MEHAEEIAAAPVAGQLQQSWRHGYWGVGPGDDCASGQVAAESSGQVAAECSGQDPNWLAEVLPAFCLAVVRPATGFSLLPLPPLLLLLPTIFFDLAPDFEQPRGSLRAIALLGPLC